MEALKNEGYHGHAQIVDTAAFLPQRRDRIWMVFFKGKPGLGKMTFEHLEQLKPEPRLLEAFLSADPDVPTPPRGVKRPVNVNLKWPKRTVDFVKDVPMSRLSARHAVKSLHAAHMSPFRASMIFQVDQCVLRTPWAVGRCPCICPRGRFGEQSWRGPVAQLPGTGSLARYRKTRAADTCSAPARCWQCISSAGAGSTSFGGVYSLDPGCLRQTGK